MVMIQLKGRVTDSGKLEFDVPVGLPPGDAEITIQINESDETFTPEEIADLLIFTPQSGAEVVAAGLTGTWADEAIDDPVAWVDAQRRKQQERNQW